MKTSSLCDLRRMDRADRSPPLRSFERHLRAANRAESTIASYLASLRQAERFLAPRDVGLPDAQRADLEAFLADLLARWKPATAATRYKVLRLYYQWLEEEGEVTANPPRSSARRSCPSSPSSRPRGRPAPAAWHLRRQGASYGHTGLVYRRGIGPCWRGPHRAGMCSRRSLSNRSAAYQPAVHRGEQFAPGVVQARICLERVDHAAGRLTGWRGGTDKPREGIRLQPTSFSSLATVSASGAPRPSSHCPRADGPVDHQIGIRWTAPWLPLSQQQAKV